MPKGTKEEVLELRKKLKSGEISLENYLNYLNPPKWKERLQEIFKKFPKDIQNQFKNNLPEFSLFLYYFVDDLMKEENITFKEALKVIASYYNVKSEDIRKAIFLNEAYIALNLGENELWFNNYVIAYVNGKEYIKRINAINILRNVFKKIKNKIKDADYTDIKELAHIIYENLGR